MFSQSSNNNMVLGVKVDDITINEAVGRVDGWLQRAGKHWISTPNPEIIVAAQNDPEFKKILNEADLAIPDGVGLRLAGVKNRLTGVDLMLELVKLAGEKGYTVGFLGGRDGVAERTSERLKVKYPNIKVSFSGDELPDQESREDNHKQSLRSPSDLKSLIINHNSIPNTDLLFVAFGHGKQEKWIAKNLEKIPVKVAMGIGGAFDYISGKVPRAPVWVRLIGLEWLFRLMVQPWRIKRQLSLIKFLWLISNKKDV